MRRLSISAIKGDEVLARDVIGENDRILLPAGSKLKIEYVGHLQRIGITSVYIIDEISKGVDTDKISEDSIREECLRNVKSILERFSYNADTEENDINTVAEEIINEVLEEKNVMYCLAGVRQRGDFMYSHSINVAALSVVIAIHMGLQKQVVKDIAVGGLLHDIGYHGITVKWDKRGSEEYTNEEKREIKKHVIYGYSMVEKEAWLSETSKSIILSHHELVDGSGYPFKIDGEHMKLPVKIVSLCNEFDVLVYGMHEKSLKIHEAIEYIMSQSGIRFEHSVVQAFYEIVAAYPNGTIVVTSEQDVGIVLRQNHKCPTRPVIRLLQDKDGKRYKSWVEKDLIECLTLFITDTLETI